MYFASSLALAWCSATMDVAVATSIFSGFCGQYTNNAGVITGTTTASVMTATATGQCILLAWEDG